VCAACYIRGILENLAAYTSNIYYMRERRRKMEGKKVEELRKGKGGRY